MFTFPKSTKKIRIIILLRRVDTFLHVKLAAVPENGINLTNLGNNQNRYKFHIMGKDIRNRV